MNYVLLRVDRIDGDVRVGPADSFQRPDGFDIRSVFPADPKLLGESEGEPALALVRIFASRATLVIRELGPGAVRHQHPDGSIDVAVPCVNRLAFRNWLLGMTVNAVVLEPPELRTEIIDWLTQVAETAQ